MSTGTNQALSFEAPSRALDKIFYRPPTGSQSVTQSATPVAPTYTAVTINHGLNQLFMLDMQLSIDNSTWYEMGSAPLYFDVPTASAYPQFIGYWSMTATAITLQLAALQASYTMYYRIVGYPTA